MIGALKRIKTIKRIVNLLTRGRRIKNEDYYHILQMNIPAYVLTGIIQCQRQRSEQVH